MSRKSPALSSSASAPGSGPSQQQATFGSTVRQVSQEGISAEDIHFRKASWLSSSALEFGGLHCGLRGNRNHDPLKTKQTSIPNRNHDPSRRKKASIPFPCIKWTCPPKFNLNADWQVAAGGQSQERRAEEQREAHVTEVIYPHPSAIPNSPSISLDVEEIHGDDDHDIPIIPITAIEDIEADSSHKIEADVAAAATVAWTVLMKSKEQGSMIDTDLLIKILSEPMMIELLKVTQPSGNEKATVQQEVKQENSYTIQPALDRPPVLNSNNLLPSVSRDPVKGGSINFPTKVQLLSDISAMTLSEASSSSVPPPRSVPDMLAPIYVQPLPQKLENWVHGSFPVPNLPAPSVPMSNRAPIIPMQEDPRSCFPTPPPQHSSLPSGSSAYKSSSSGQPSQPIRDANYYKNLIRQHGVERQFGNQISLREPDNLSIHLQRQGHGMPTISSPAPCIYFNSPKGCRRGLSCPFMHEFPSGFSDPHSCKRPKLD